MSSVHFGGPDFARGRLRQHLQAAVRAVPAGGEIAWATYYFRDEDLARTLVEAARRGVRVRCVLEARPRIAAANDAVKAILSAGLAEGLSLVNYPGVPAPRGKAWKPQFHEKIYCFSHPQPAALVGSFNPSGNGADDDPRILRRIGDQDIGDNVLVELTDPPLVEGLFAHVRQMHRRSTRLLDRLAAPPPLTGARASAYFWPRIGRHPVVELLRGASGRARIRIAASHIRSGDLVRILRKLARQGADIMVLAEATRRRVPPAIEGALRSAGVNVRRMPVEDPPVPMHLKLLLLEEDERRTVVFGSYNWTLPSFHLNNEVAVLSTDPALYEALADRWQSIYARHHASAADPQEVSHG